MSRNIDEIKALILSNATIHEWVNKSREYSKELKALIKGQDFADLLVKIDHLESEDRIKARKKFAHSIKDVSERLLRHVDNVYSASGDSFNLNIDETNKPDVLKSITNIRGNQSLKSWLKTYWAKTILHTDPAGLLMFEWKDEKLYPVYKSISCIRNYEAHGQNVEWVLFEPFKATAKIIKDKYDIDIQFEGTKDIVRYYDEAIDVFFIQESKELTYLVEFANLFGQCPAIVASNIVDPDSGLRLTPVDGIVELLKEYLRDQSIKLIYKIQHGIPQFWRVASKCPTCNGTGKIDNKVCPDCKGRGTMGRKDITDEIRIPLNDDGTMPNISKAMGWEAPPLEVWKQYNDEEDRLVDKLNKTHWGSIFIEGGNDTATGRFIDTQPVINRLNDYSDVAEWIDWQMCEWIVNFKMPQKNKEEHVVSLGYGRRFIIESPDVLLKLYNESKSAGDPISILDKQLTDYLTAKYKTDIETLSEMLIKKELEPYPHYTLDEVAKVMGNKEAQKKMLFLEWYQQINPLIKNDKVKLTKEWDAFILAKIGEAKETTTALSVQLGVGGTQSLQLIISDRLISTESKKGILKVLFGLTDEDINLIISEPTAIEGNQNQIT